MFDARIFIDSLENAKKILRTHNAVCKGDYIIHDAIYRSSDSDQSLGEIFLRLRTVSKNIWDEKPYIVSIKNTKLKKIGKQSIIPVKEQFDSERAALEYVEQNHSKQFLFSFEFNRTGEQYFIGEDCVDLEIIEGYPSIEFKSKTEDGLGRLLKLFNVQNEQVIKGPSIIAVRELLKV